MELEKLSEEIAKAISKAYEQVREENQEHRARWFTTDDDGNKTQVREEYVIFGEKATFAKIAFEDIHPVSVDEIQIDLNIPTLEVGREDKGLRKLICDFFKGRKKELEEIKSNKVKIKTSRTDPPPGLEVLQRMAAREVKEHYMHTSPDIAKIMLHDEQQNNNDEETS